MAKMFPEWISEAQRTANPNLRAEFKVYDTLRTSLSDEWYVIYSGVWTWVEKKNRLRIREEDFIIAHPQLGVLLLEVKGGGIKVESGKWKSVDRHGVEHDISDNFDNGPYGQVAAAASALERFLKDYRPNPFQGYSFATAVCFPDSVLPDESPHISADMRHVTIDAPKLRKIQQSVVEILKNADGSFSEVGEMRLVWLKELLAPSWYVNVPLSIQINDTENEIKKLTENQFKVLQFGWTAKRLLVTGCAGSGKTLMAAETARRLVLKKQKKVLFVCYNRNLADWIRTSQFFVDNGLMLVANYHKLCADFIKSAELELPEMPGVTKVENETFVRDELPNLLIEAASIIKEQFDAIIVDEGQDFFDNWWTSLLLLLKDNGQFHVYYDAHQRLWGPPRQLPEDITLGEEPIDLDENIRNTRPIHKLAMRYHPTQGKGYKASISSNLEPEFIPIPDGKTEMQVVTDIVKRLVEDEKVPTRDIGILTPLSMVEGNSMWKPDKTLLGKYRVVHHLGVKPHEIFCSSIGAAKGIEFPVVILTELHSPSIQHEIADFVPHLYVGVSRARSHLIIVGSTEQFDQLGTH